MPRKSPQPCFTISAELHEKITRSCTPIYQDPIETVTPRCANRKTVWGEAPVHRFTSGPLGIGRFLGLLGL